MGTLRLHWGQDAPFPEEFETTYDLSRFRHLIRDEQMVISTRFMVHKRFRNSLLPFQMVAKATRFALENGIQLAFCDCRPHLLNLYEGMGFRTYHQTFNDPGMGLMVPLLMLVQDRDYLGKISSPLERYYSGLKTDTMLLEKLEQKIPHRPPVRETASAFAHDWIEVYAALEGQTREAVNVFEGLSVIPEGGLVGEMAFLTAGPRSADVIAVVDETQVVALDERELHRLVKREPAIAARLLHNISRILCSRLVALTQRVVRNRSRSS